MMTTETKPRRPILRYHGGKWRLAPWVISHFPPHDIYVEPFGGAASVLLRKTRVPVEIYNDIDGEVVNLFRVARDRGGELMRLLELTPFARDEYYGAMEAAGDPLEDARRLVVRSFMGFGSDAHLTSRRSGFRAMRRRLRSHPAHEWANLPEAYKAIIERLRGVVIENKAALEVMRRQDCPDALHYCDPPYVLSTRMMNSHSKKCYAHEMSDDQHRELAAFVRTLKGQVIVSGYDCPLYQELYGDWRSTSRQALIDGGRTRTETVWFSPNCPRLSSLEFPVWSHR